jgi:hypothetical protein
MTTPQKPVADAGTTAAADWWATGISDIAPGSIRFHGYAIEELIGAVTFPQMI